MSSGKKHSTSTKPLVSRWISWLMPREMPECSSTRASKPPAPKSKPAPALPGRAAHKKPPALPSAICPRPSSKATRSWPHGREVLAIVKDGQGVPAAKAGEEVEVVLDHTSFYADSGGQIGDTGSFLSSDGNTTVAEIVGCVAPVQGVRAHKAILKQDLAVGDRVQTVVDGDRRDAIRRNHTGTHLLHAALRQVLGTHVKQAGSAVHPDRLRFDFSHYAQVADEELEEIESIVNREVLKNATVETLVDVPIDVAVNEYHAMALFGEKYGDKVRVVKLSDGFSTELCGGTHTAATGEIGLFKLTGETSVSSGVRRIEAISGMGSLDTFRRDFAVAQFASSIAGSPDGDLSEALRARVAAHEEEIKRLRRELDETRMKSAAGALDEVLSATPST